MFSSLGILLIESESALNCVTDYQYSILPVLCTVGTEMSKARFLLRVSLGTGHVTQHAFVVVVQLLSHI